MSTTPTQDDIISEQRDQISMLEAELGIIVRNNKRKAEALEQAHKELETVTLSRDNLAGSVKTKDGFIQETLAHMDECHTLLNNAGVGYGGCTRLADRIVRLLRSLPADRPVMISADLADTVQTQAGLDVHKLTPSIRALLKDWHQAAYEQREKIAKLKHELERLQATVRVRDDQVSNQAVAVREYRDQVAELEQQLADCHNVDWSECHKTLDRIQPQTHGHQLTRRLAQLEQDWVTADKHDTETCAKLREAQERVTELEQQLESQDFATLYDRINASHEQIDTAGIDMSNPNLATRVATVLSELATESMRATSLTRDLTNAKVMIADASDMLEHYGDVEPSEGTLAERVKILCDSPVVKQLKEAREQIDKERERRQRYDSELWLINDTLKDAGIAGLATRQTHESVGILARRLQGHKSTIDHQQTRLSHQLDTVNEQRDKINTAHKMITDAGIAGSVESDIPLLDRLGLMINAQSQMHSYWHQQIDQTNELLIEREQYKEQIGQLEQRLDKLASILRDAGAMTDCLDITGALQHLVNANQQWHCHYEREKDRVIALNQELADWSTSADQANDRLARLEALKDLTTVYASGAILDQPGTSELLNTLLTMLFGESQHILTTEQIVSTCQDAVTKYRESHGLNKLDRMLEQAEESAEQPE